MREHQKKGVLKQKTEASLYILDWGFKKIVFSLYTYVLTKILQNGAKFRCAKAGFEKLQEIEHLQTSSGKFKKLKFDALLSKKYIPSAKTLYTVDLSDITCNYLCVDSPNYICHF